MPRIPPDIEDCSIYLYPTKSDAKSGESAGGSGFLLGVATEYKPRQLGWHLYVVTNSHVIREGACRVIRLNTRDGFDVLSTEDGSWVHHPFGDDLAACRISPLDVHRFSFVEYERLLSRDQVYNNRVVVPGMDVFLVGRCFSRDGKQRNTPTVRMGNVAQLPDEPIPHLRGIDQEGFLVEMRSIGGSSGSPAFVFVKYAEMKSVSPSVQPSGLQITWKDDWMLLGVNWGHIRKREKVFQNIDGATRETDFFIEGNIGMACVVPAWKLTELIDSEPLQTQREEEDHRRRNGPVDGLAVSD